MAHLLRLIAIWCVFASTNAMALIPAQAGFKVSGTPDSEARPTYEAACAQFVVYMNIIQPGKNFRTPTSLNPQGYGCRYIYDNPGPTQNIVQFVNAAASCPANSNAVSQTHCQCNTNFLEVGGACVPKPKTCDPGSVYSAASQRSIGTGATMPAAGVAGLFQQVPKCSDGCEISGAAVRAQRGLDGNTWTLVIPELQRTGGSCTEGNADLDINTRWDDAKQQDNEPSNCPAGKCPGQINGVDVCAACTAVGTASTSTSSTTGTQATTGGSNGDGSGSGSGSGGGQPSVIGSAGPSNSSDSQMTICDGKTCTTTRTTSGTASGGTGTGTGTGGAAGGTNMEECARAVAAGNAVPATCSNTSTTSEPQADFCGKNPKHASCVNDEGQSGFSGTCATGFQPSGDDAVLNAMAKEVHEQNCKMNPDAESQALAGTERGKTGNQTGDNPNNTAISLTSASFDTSDALGGGSGCIADKTISVAGGSVTLPLSEWCNSFELLGTLLLGVSFLLAAVIVMRG